VSRFTAVDLPLAGLKYVERQRLNDRRGFLSRLFCAEELGDWGWSGPVAQINHSYTRHKGSVRGLHFQRSPHCEIKLVSVIRGEVWDVAVDLRRNSTTFLHWHGELLSAENGRAMLIPRGFAHGFQTLTDDVEVLYCHSTAYNANAEAGLNPLDAALEIAWPHTISEMTTRDRAHPAIDKDFTGIVF
jgi:dTDP-4-dehydrorhamnose 3,5-epimerase